MANCSISTDTPRDTPSRRRQMSAGLSSSGVRTRRERSWVPRHSPPRCHSRVRCARESGSCSTFMVGAKDASWAARSVPPSRAQVLLQDQAGDPPGRIHFYGPQDVEGVGGCARSRRRVGDTEVLGLAIADRRSSAPRRSPVLEALAERRIRWARSRHPERVLHQVAHRSAGWKAA